MIDFVVDLSPYAILLSASALFLFSIYMLIQIVLEERFNFRSAFNWITVLIISGIQVFYFFLLVLGVLSPANFWRILFRYTDVVSGFVVIYFGIEEIRKKITIRRQRESLEIYYRTKRNSFKG